MYVLYWRVYQKYQQPTTVKCLLLWNSYRISEFKRNVKQPISVADSAEGRGEGEIDAAGDRTTFEGEADAGCSSFVLDGTSW